jgi:alkylation response protein AidB-like acyl-CoA dehydrogenase
VTDQIDELPALVTALIDRTLGLEMQAFLGEQFDAGLAWVHHDPGDGGLSLPRSLQGSVDDTLSAAGRLSDWHRNPMGIGMCGPAIARHGTPAQRARYLRPIFTAKEIWCQLFSEPGAGSDVATLATRAVPDGDGWIVDGHKVWTSWGSLADFGLLLARTDPDVPKHSGLTAFLVDMRAPGVEVRPLRQMTGESEFSEVYLTGVRLPDAARLGLVGGGWQVAITTLMNERVSIGGSVDPRSSGPIADALETWRHTRPHSPVQRDVLAGLWIQAEVLRLAKIRAQQLRTSSGTPGAEGSLLKLGSALLAQEIRSFVLDLLAEQGMIAYDPDDPPKSRDGDNQAAHFLWSPSHTIGGGTSDVMRGIIGERVLGLPKEEAADRGVPWRSIPRGG